QIEATSHCCQDCTGGAQRSLGSAKRRIQPCQFEPICCHLRVQRKAAIYVLLQGVYPVLQRIHSALCARDLRLVAAKLAVCVIQPCLSILARSSKLAGDIINLSLGGCDPIPSTLEFALCIRKLLLKLLRARGN